MTDLTHGELFAGIGGFGAGMERAGVKTLWHVEIDKKCQDVLRKHYPDTPIFDDVCECGSHNLEYVDIITFGSPCQDLSIAGKREGLVGKRSGLFHQAVRIIREIGPKYAVWENVPGALSSNKGYDFREILSALVGRDVPMPGSGRWANAGVVRSGEIEVAWRILDAQYLGVPQRRRRVFVVVGFRGASASEILFEREGVCWNPPTRTKEGKDVTAPVTTSAYADNESQESKLVAFSGGNSAGSRGIGYSEEVTPPIRSGSSGTNQVPTIAGTLDGKSACSNRGSQANEAEFIVPVAFQQNTRDEVRLMSGDGSIVGALSAEPGAKQQNYLAFGGGNTQEIDIATTQNAGGNGRIDFESETLITSGTIAASGAGTSRPAGQGNELDFVIRQSYGVRRLTPIETLRLQGFPDDWCDGESDSAIYKQAGNAVCVNVAEWITKRIVKYDLP